MVRPAWDNWWLLENQYAAAAADYLPVTVGIEAGGSFLSLPVLD